MERPRATRCGSSRPLAPRTLPPGVFALPRRPRSLVGRAAAPRRGRRRARPRTPAGPGRVPLACAAAAKQLLEKVLAAVTEHPELGEIYLHVQISNESALAFYEKFDFVRGEKLDNYYKRIEPPHCFILRRAL